MRVGGGGHHSLKLTRHVWMGRRRTSVYYGSTALLLWETSSSTARCWSSDFFHKPAAHHRSTLLVLTSQTSKDGSNGGSSGGKDPGDQKTATTSTDTPTSGTNGSNDDSTTTTPTTENGGNNSPFRGVPRRIVVKKSSSNNTASTTDNTPRKGSDGGNFNATNKHLKQPPQEHVGYLKRRFPLHNEIADTNNKTIWIPAKPIVVESTRTTNNEPSLPHMTSTTIPPHSNDNIIIKQQLAQIRAGAWLDPSTYCKGGGTTIAGTEAARKLLRGKKDLIELLGYAVHSHSKQSLVLQSHGIPRQVLQHHIDYAARLLGRLEAQEVSFKQFNEIAKYNSVAAMDAVQSLRRVLVRSAVTGESRALPWPLDDVPVEENESENSPPQQQQQQQWVDDLTLYWTVMNRIATRLGVAVLLKRPGLGRDRLELMTTAGMSPEPQQQQHSMLRTPPYYWKVEFQRELHFSPEQLPPTGRSLSNSSSGDNRKPSVELLSPPQHLFPVLEFTPLQGVAAPGHCRIRLQGTGHPGGGGEPMNVSLSFDACFRIHHFAPSS